MTVWRRIQRTQKRVGGVGVLGTVPLPRFADIILLDGKQFRIRKKPYTLYVALDSSSGRPLCWILLPRYELRDGYDFLLSYLKRKNVVVQAVVSDWHQGLLASVSEYYPYAIHQRCAAHVLREVFYKIGGRRFFATPYGKTVWVYVRTIVLGFMHEKEAQRYLKRVKNKFPIHAKAWDVLEEALPTIYRFADDPSYPIPRTSNRIENFMGCLEQRLKIFRSTKTPETTARILTSIIYTKYNLPTNL